MITPNETRIEASWLTVQNLRIRCLQAGIGGSPAVLLHGGAVDGAGESFGDIRRTLLAGGAALGYALQRPERVEHLVLVESYGLGRELPGGWRDLQRNDVLWGHVATGDLDRLPELAVTTMLIHGANDPAVPVAWAERAHDLIRGSQLAVIPSSGHVTPLEQPEPFNAALQKYLTE